MTCNHCGRVTENPAVKACDNGLELNIEYTICGHCGCYQLEPFEEVLVDRPNAAQLTGISLEDAFKFYEERQRSGQKEQQDGG